MFELGFSPLGTFIITWQRPSKDENGDAVKNLIVWRVVQAGGVTTADAESVLGRFVQKSQTGWNLQYTQDEKYCARLVTNEVQFYESGDLTTVWNKLRVEGVQDFAVSPGQTNSVAVFVPERKGQPAAVKIYNVPNFGAPVSQKTFFKGDKVQLKWNQQGTSLIVLAQTEVDKSGKSYYGETTMYLLSAGGGFDSRVDLSEFVVDLVQHCANPGTDKEGPIHDVTWSPNSKEFGVVYGYMPAKTTIFNARAVATHEFALGPRNTISFSPDARFVLVAGFGNLAGDVDIYDLRKDYQKVCTFKASNSSVCEWSPDGKYLLAATTSPRLRVDNGVRIWHVGGGLMYNEDMHELYHVVWRPQSPLAYPPSDPLNPVPTPHPSALAFLGTVKTPSKPAGAYRPPGARGTTTPLAFMREDQGGAAFVSEGSTTLHGTAAVFGKQRRREVPGAEPAASAVPGAEAVDGDENLSKAALKNKKKREARKAKDAADKENGLVTVEPSETPGRSPERRAPRAHERARSYANSEQYPQSRTRSRNPSRRRDSYAPRGNGPSPAAPVVNGMTIDTAVVPAPMAQPDLSVTSPGGATSQDKKIRALTKKLRAIDDLKMRRAGGEKLEGTQIKKMETEDSVRKELESLGWAE